MQPCPRERVLTTLDWYAVTHATCCPRRKNPAKRVEFFLIGNNNLRKMWTEKSRPKGQKSYLEKIKCELNLKNKWPLKFKSNYQYA